MDIPYTWGMPWQTTDAMKEGGEVRWEQRWQAGRGARRALYAVAADPKPLVRRPLHSASAGQASPTPPRAPDVSRTHAASRAPLCSAPTPRRALPLYPYPRPCPRRAGRCRSSRAAPVRMPRRALPLYPVPAPVRMPRREPPLYPYPRPCRAATHRSVPRPAPPALSYTPLQRELRTKRAGCSQSEQGVSGRSAAAARSAGVTQCAGKKGHGI